MRIAVTGASGQIGSQVMRLLAGEQAHQVVALSLRVPPSGRWPTGVSAGAAGYADPEALSTALRGADTLVLDSGDRPMAQIMVRHHNVIRAARASGVARIAALSGLDADPCSPFCYAVSYGYTERLLTASRCLVSIARHRSTASSSPASWPAPAPAARSGSPPPTAGYRWSPALTSRDAWRRSQSGPRAATTTSPALSPSTWLPSQLRRHAWGTALEYASITPGALGGDGYRRGGPVVDVRVLDDVRLDPGATLGGSRSCHWSMPVPQPPRPAGSQIAASPGIRTPW